MFLAVFPDFSFKILYRLSICPQTAVKSSVQGRVLLEYLTCMENGTPNKRKWFVRTVLLPSSGTKAINMFAGLTHLAEFFFFSAHFFALQV